jgi:hypothetical protein
LTNERGICFKCDGLRVRQYSRIIVLLGEVKYQTLPCSAGFILCNTAFGRDCKNIEIFDGKNVPFRKVEGNIPKRVKILL